MRQLVLTTDVVGIALGAATDEDRVLGELGPIGPHNQARGNLGQPRNQVDDPLPLGNGFGRGLWKIRHGRTPDDEGCGNACEDRCPEGKAMHRRGRGSTGFEGQCRGLDDGTGFRVGKSGLAHGKNHC